MKILHQVGWRDKWNLDTHYQNGIGDGFIFCAYSFAEGDLVKKILSKHSDIISKSFFDLQYFGKKESGNIAKGNLSTYSFHPAAKADDNTKTSTLIYDSIIAGINYQISLGLKNIIIPNYYENDNLDEFIKMVKDVNKWLIRNRKNDLTYFMTVPIAHHTIIDQAKVEALLYEFTDMKISFDGYYIMCESKPERMQKISVDFKYLRNLTRIFQVLNKQGFKTIYGYANWDAIVFLATTNIDYVTIGSYENLRNFNIQRFLESEDGGPSKGWYFSEKLLNFIKAQLIDLIRMQKGLDLIRNERNIFSDDALQPNYPWSNQKAEVHKNYLLAISRLLNEIGSIENLKVRKSKVIQKIEIAIKAYDELEDKSIYLSDPSSKNYHLNNWLAFLRSK